MANIGGRGEGGEAGGEARRKAANNAFGELLAKMPEFAHVGQVTARRPIPRLVVQRSYCFSPAHLAIFAHNTPALLKKLTWGWSTLPPPFFVSSLLPLVVFLQLFNSSASVNLTEDEAEYCVAVVKHIFPEHIIFQFTIKNTMEEQQLEDVEVHMDMGDAPVTPENPNPKSPPGCSILVSKRAQETTF